MSAVIMDGKALAEKIKGEIASRVLKLSKKPVLGTILVGSDPGSKLAKAQELGVPVIDESRFKQILSGNI